MARFICTKGGQYPVVILEAEDDEELSADEARAWAALQQAYALERISKALDGIGAEIGGAGAAIARR